MSKSAINFPEIQNLQNEVIAFLSGHLDLLHLSGGIALGKYYLNHRNTADLDIFVHQYPGFEQTAAKILELLKNRFGVVEDNTVATPDYYRIYVTGKETLKIELKNDPAERWGLPRLAGAVMVEPVANMLANKIKAIMDRDVPFDLFDTISMASSYSFSWNDVFFRALRKAIMYQVDLMVRLRRRTLMFHQFIRGGEPKNLFDILKIPSPMQYVLTYLTISVEAGAVFHDTDQEKIFTDPVEFATELRRITTELSIFLDRDEPFEAREMDHITQTLRLRWGGASTTVQRCRLVNREDVALRFRTFPAEHFAGNELLVHPLNLPELKEKFRQVSDDMIRGCENSLGIGKTPLLEARPVIF